MVVWDTAVEDVVGGVCAALEIGRRSCVGGSAGVGIDSVRSCCILHTSVAPDVLAGVVAHNVVARGERAAVSMASPRAAAAAAAADSAAGAGGDEASSGAGACELRCPESAAAAAAAFEARAAEDPMIFPGS